MERVIKYNQFRNIGLEETQTLILNSDFRKGRMGNLLIVIGSNNSGKSNVLDGIIKLQNGEIINKRDVTNLYFDNEHKNPTITLCYRDKGENKRFEFIKGYNNNGSWKIVGYEDPTILPPIDVIRKECEIIKQLVLNMGMNLATIDSLLNDISNSNLDEATLKQRIIDGLGRYASKVMQIYGTQQWNNMKRQFPKLADFYFASTNDAAERLISKFKETIGVDALPTIHNYVEQRLSTNELNINNVNDVRNNRFFKSLLAALEIDPQTILNAYGTYSEQQNIAVLSKLERQFSSKMDKLNEQFNRMYFASNDKYKFTLRFSPNQIAFGMARGKDEDAIMLDYQSVGFRWFFNLFFNFLTSNVLRAGDIVVMDEPATNLHPEGQIELRKFIKDFAIKNDILFVIATQSPFLIDSDYLDELRVVSMDNNRSKIENLFTAINIEDPDSLLPIKRSLTIKQNVIYDYDTEVVWTEGITDYNYLTMFKRLLGIKNIAFLPFNGVGSTPDETKQILKRLLEIKLYKRSLLVDGDKAGDNMFKEAEKTEFKDRVHKISELTTEDKKFVTIEDLFSKEDKRKYSVILEKKGHGSADLKTHATLKDFSEETISNFKRLFEIIQDQ